MTFADDLITALREDIRLFAQSGNADWNDGYLEALTNMIGRIGELRPDQIHPEQACSRCGGPNIPWSAPSPLWNQVMRGGDINGVDEHDGIVCPTCFGVLAQERGVAELWRFYAERVHVPLQTVTPGGRVWNAETWLWDVPAPVAAHAGQDETRHTRTGHDRRAAVSRHHYLPAPVYRDLDRACVQIRAAFGTPYLVGSATQRPDYRDVDVRVIIDDGEFAGLFGGRADAKARMESNVRWSLICSLVSRHLATATGLPVDFQVQSRSQADREQADGKGTRCIPLGIVPVLDDPLPGAAPVADNPKET